MTLAAQIDAIVGQAIAERVFPGAVVHIGSRGKAVYQGAHGTTMYGAAGSQAVQLGTIYDIASLTKMFTATAALRLYDAGALDLQAPVQAYLPRFGASSILVQHLLTHTSGLDIRLSSFRHGSRAALLEAVYRLAPAVAPGSAVAYTNVNSLLLGQIVAELYGAPLDRALHELVLGPLGLRDTFFCPAGDLLGRIAPTELDEEWRGGLVHGHVHDESAHLLGGVAGHAGLFSTAEDIYRFCDMWLAAYAQPQADQTFDKAALLRSATARLAMRSHTGGLKSACGLGWMIDRPNFMGCAPSGSVGHTGFTGPAMVIVPSQRLIVVVLTNRVYPKRGAPTHHALIAAMVSAACQAKSVGLPGAAA